MGDLNGHVGTGKDGLKHVIGASGIGDRNREGERLRIGFPADELPHYNEHLFQT